MSKELREIKKYENFPRVVVEQKIKRMNIIWNKKQYEFFPSSPRSKKEKKL